MKDSIQAGTPADDRTAEQLARAAPVHLPAGSYDSAALQRDLDEAAKANTPGDRDVMVAAAIEKHNETGADKLSEPAADAAPAGKTPNNPAVGTDAAAASKGE